tara:strand:- start:924 stop:1541 length:618 start_codon:yes stop_codon:yes gene_type:complete
MFNSRLLRIEICIFIILLFFPLSLYCNYEKAIELYNNKQYPESILEFQRFIDSEIEHEKKKDAMYNLAIIYDFGLGTKENKDKAVKWYKMASSLNHKVAQFNLAWMYYNGEKLEKNNFEAFNYYLKSANQGYNKAQFNLANLYFAGEGTITDYVESYKWFKISSLNGIIESSDFLSKLEKKLHPEELDLANQKVQNWIKGYKKTD